MDEEAGVTSVGPALNADPHSLGLALSVPSGSSSLFAEDPDQLDPGLGLLPEQTHDLVGVEPLIQVVEFDMLLGDKAFDADWLRSELDDRGAVAVIPPKTNRTGRHVGRAGLRGRWTGLPGRSGAQHCRCWEDRSGRA